MSECPEVVVLEGRGWPLAVSAHVAACGSCKLVMELIEERSQAAASRDRRVECAKFEALLAVRVAGGIGTTAGRMLDEHLDECDECRAIAETMAPENDRTGDQTTLATIERSAYALGPEVARGGMGRIVSARDLRIGRPVAVKELLANTSTQAARFEREARVTARLQHPGIVPIYEIGRWANGTPFYSMRMVAGRTLRAELADRETVAARLALLPAVITASEAVAFAHSNRVIHRDLTPSNIMVGEYGETVVIDWGLAKDFGDETVVTVDDDVLDAGPYRRDPSAPDDLTIDGAIIGTASYMPPEQAAGDRVDARADVYALGAILYHVLVGQAPYRGRNDVVLAAVKAGPPPKVAVEAPRDLVSIMEKAMARDPADRYPSARELAAELSAFQAGRLVESHRYSRGELVRRWIRRRRAAVAIAAVAVVVLATGGALALVNIVRQRDRAESGERDAVLQREVAKQASTALLVELGRERLLAGEGPQAAAYLSAAYANGETSSELRFLLGSAMGAVESVEHVLVGSKEPVRALALTRDRERLLVIRATTAEQWSIADGKRLATLAAPHFSDGAYAADGRTIVTWSDDGIVRIWDAETGRAGRTLAAPGTKLALLSDDGARVLTVDGDGVAKTWSIASGAVVETVPLGPGRPVAGRSRFVALLSADRVVVRDLLAGTQFAVVSPPLVGDGDLTDDGSRMILCGGNDINMWDNMGRLVRTWHLAGTRDVIGCQFDMAQKRVMAEDARGTASIWDVASGELIAEVSIGDGQVLAILAGDRIVSGLKTTTIAVRDAGTGSVLASYPSNASYPSGTELQALIAAHDRLVIPGADGSIAIIDLAGGRAQKRYAGAEHPDESFGGVSDTRLVTFKGSEAVVRDLRQGRILATTGIPMSVSDSMIIGMSSDRRAMRYDARTGAELGFFDFEARPADLDFDRAGDRMLVTTHGGPIETWDVGTHTQIASRPAAPAGFSAGLTPDGRHLLLTRTFDRWTLENLDGSDPRVLAEHVFLVALSRDGARMAISDNVHDAATREDHETIVVMDLATGGRLFEVSDDSVQAALDGGGELLATKGGEKIEIWSVSSKQLLRTISGKFGAGVALSADGELVATERGVWSTLDGHQLAATSPIVLHPHATTNQVGEATVGIPLMSTMMSVDGAFAVNYTWAPHGDITLWGMPREFRSPAEIERVLAARSPWRVELGKLVER